MINTELKEMDRVQLEIEGLTEGIERQIMDRKRYRKIVRVFLYKDTDHYRLIPNTFTELHRRLLIFLTIDDHSYSWLLRIIQILLIVDQLFCCQFIFRWIEDHSTSCQICINNLLILRGSITILLIHISVNRGSFKIMSKVYQ